MIEATPLPGLNILRAQVFEDDRGSFAEMWSDRGLSVQGLHHDWCQENRSHSRRAGTLRGLHYQAPPAAQAKLVSCTRGRIWDVAVDIRRGSPTYGRPYGLVLSANDWVQLLVPKGFLHGFLTLEDDTVVQYKVDAPYVPGLEGSIAWDDPELAIEWPDMAVTAISPKDRHAPRFFDWSTPFEFLEPVLEAQP